MLIYVNITKEGLNDQRAAGGGRRAAGGGRRAAGGGRRAAGGGRRAAGGGRRAAGYDVAKFAVWADCGPS